jgi:hypothetical protein
VLTRFWLARHSALDEEHHSCRTAACPGRRRRQLPKRPPGRVSRGRRTLHPASAFVIRPTGIPAAALATSRCRDVRRLRTGSARDSDRRARSPARSLRPSARRLVRFAFATHSITLRRPARRPHSYTTARMPPITRATEQTTEAGCGEFQDRARRRRSVLLFGFRGVAALDCRAWVIASVARCAGAGCGRSGDPSRPQRGRRPVPSGRLVLSRGWGGSSSAARTRNLLTARAL